MTALMQRILKAAGPYGGRIRLAFVFAFLKSLLAKAPIGLAVWLLTAFYREEATPALCLRCGAAMLACLLLQVVCQNLADRLQSAAGFLAFADKRMELGQHLRRMPMGYFTEGNIGKISSVLSTDMVFIEENCMTVLADMMSYLFAQAILLVFLLAMDWRLGLAALAVLAGAVLTGRAMKGSMMADSAARQEQSENLTEAVLDFVEGIGVIKAYNLLGERSRELTGNFRRSCDVSLQFEREHAPWQRRLYLVTGVGTAAVLGLAVWMQARGALSVTLFTGLLLFVFDLFGPIKALYTQSTRLTVMSSCLDRMEEVFRAPELADTGRQPIPAQGDAPELEFRDVRFGYGEAEVLHGVSFAAQPGQMVALVGPSGGGKSTVASLLTRFWDVQGGQVLVRGQDIRTVPLADLMAHISMVFQRVYLFQDTVYNNIAMGRPGASREEVIEAAKKARCYDFIMRLPQGFDTMVGEGGASLSGGEMQRLSIARCILKDAPIVILDEATASVDADNESYIQQAIGALCRGKTLLVIAHRLGTIRNADQILVLAGGEIVQRGTHRELMQAGGLYRDFVTVRQESLGWNRREQPQPAR